MDYAFYVDFNAYDKQTEHGSSFVDTHMKADQLPGFNINFHGGVFFLASDK